MNIIETDIKGVVIIEPRLFCDERGYFFESFNQNVFIEKVCKRCLFRIMSLSQVME